MNATKVNTLRYKSLPWNNNILTVAYADYRLPTTRDTRVPILPTQRKPSSFTYCLLPIIRLHLRLPCRLASCCCLAQNTLHIFPFLLFAHKNSYIYALTSFPEKANEREESPWERECVGNTPSTHKKKIMDRPETDKKTSSVADLNWFTASLYRATPRLDFSGF